MHKSLNSLNCSCQIVLVLLMMLLPGTVLHAQRNGDDLAFQGLAQPNETSARALALGGAFATQWGDVNSLQYNPAGLAGIEKLQISVGAAFTQQTWRDNQVWYAGGAYLFINHYLERLYIPDPAFNGIWSDSLGNPAGNGWKPEDFKTPVQGADPYSKAAADAEKTMSTAALGHFSAAYPVNVADRKVVLSAGYSRGNNLVDYDWNGTHLDPHWGNSTLLTNIAAKGDTTRSDWSVYSRERSGAIHQINTAMAVALHENVQIGIGLNTLFGGSDDQWMLDRVGYFNFIHADADGRWAFSYDDATHKITGTSDYSGLQLNTGGLINLKALDIGLQVKWPYTLERKWSYTSAQQTPGFSSTTSTAGTDRVKMPATYILGLGFKPEKNVSFTFQFEKTGYSDAEFEMATPAADTSTNLPVWADQQTLRFGIEYQLYDHFSLLAGYRSGTAVFVPQGVAIRDAGPANSSYSLGFSLGLLGGRLDAAYELRQLKYYDVYFTNRNYTLVKNNNILFNFTRSF